VADKVFKLEWEYETLADHIMPPFAAEHIKQMGRANDLLVFSITPRANQTPSADETRIQLVSADGRNSSPMALAVLAAVRGLARGKWPWPAALRYPVHFPKPSRAIEPVGLGGWLILVGFGLVTSPIRILVTLLFGKQPDRQHVTTSMAMLPNQLEHQYRPPQGW